MDLIISYLIRSFRIVCRILGPSPARWMRTRCRCVRLVAHFFSRKHTRKGLRVVVKGMKFGLLFYELLGSRLDGVEVR